MEKQFLLLLFLILISNVAFGEEYSLFFENIPMIIENKISEYDLKNALSILTNLSKKENDLIDNNVNFIELSLLPKHEVKYKKIRGILLKKKYEHNIEDLNFIRFFSFENTYVIQGFVKYLNKKNMKKKIHNKIITNHILIKEYLKIFLNEDSKNYKLVRIKTNIPDLTTNHSYSSMEYTFSRVTDGYYSKDNIIEIELNSDGELYSYNNNYIQNTYPAVINITRKEAEEIALERIKQIREFRREILYEEEVIRPKKRLQEVFDTELQRRPYLGVYREYIAEKEEMINQEIKYEVIDYFDTRIITETDEIKILLYKNKYRKDFNEISILYSKEIIERAMNQKKPVYLRPNYLYVWTEECLPESGILPKIETEDNKPYNYREMKGDDKHKYSFVVTDKERLAYIIPIKLNAEDGVLNTIYEKILTVYIDAETGEVIGGLF